MKAIPKLVLFAIICAAQLHPMEDAKQKSAAPSDQTFTGVVSDSMCATKHMMKDVSAAKCTRECVKSGSDYALVVGDKVYVLKGNRSEIDKLAGERATIKGKVSGNTIAVDSISAASTR
jgi:hypothetical protein